MIHVPMLAPAAPDQQTRRPPLGDPSHNSLPSYWMPCDYSLAPSLPKGCGGH